MNDKYETLKQELEDTLKKYLQDSDAKPYLQSMKDISQWLDKKIGA